MFYRIIFLHYTWGFFKTLYVISFPVQISMYKKQSIQQIFFNNTGNLENLLQVKFRIPKILNLKLISYCIISLFIKVIF